MNFSKHKLQTYLREDATAETNSEMASEKSSNAAATRNDRRASKMAGKQQNFSQPQGTAMRNKMQYSSFDAEALRKEKELIKMMEAQKSDWRSELTEAVVDGQEREDHPYVTVMPTGDENLIQAIKQMGKEVKKKKDSVEEGYEDTKKKEVLSALSKKKGDFKKRYGKDAADVMYAVASKTAKKKGDTSKSDDRYAYEEVDHQEIREGKRGLWDNINAKRKRGEAPAKKGDKNYPKTLNIEGTDTSEQKFIPPYKELKTVANEKAKKAARAKAMAMTTEDIEQIDEIAGAIAGAAKNLATGALVNGVAANPVAAGAVGGTIGAVTGKKKAGKKAVGTGAGTAVGGAVGGPVGALVGGVVGNKVAESTIRQRVTTKATEVGRDAAAKAKEGGQNAGPNEKKGAAIGGTLGAIGGVAVPDGPLMVAGEIGGGIVGSKIGGAIGKKFDKKNEEVEELDEEKKCKEGYEKKDGKCVKKKKKSSSSKTTIIYGRGWGHGHHHHDDDKDDDNDGGGDDGGDGGDGGGMGEMFDILGDMLLKEMNFRDAQKKGLMAKTPDKPFDWNKKRQKDAVRAGKNMKPTSMKDRAKD